MDPNQVENVLQGRQVIEFEVAEESRDAMLAAESQGDEDQESTSWETRSGGTEPRLEETCETTAPLAKLMAIIDSTEADILAKLRAGGLVVITC